VFAGLLLLPIDLVVIAAGDVDDGDALLHGRRDAERMLETRARPEIE
jgi:hypothetical protein